MEEEQALGDLLRLWGQGSLSVEEEVWKWSCASFP